MSIGGMSIGFGQSIRDLLLSARFLSVEQQKTQTQNKDKKQ
jgi:hypothetical protein